jgi:hypothetical protein
VADARLRNKIQPQTVDSQTVRLRTKDMAFNKQRVAVCSETKNPADAGL